MWLLSLGLLIFVFYDFPIAHAQLLGPNLIPNASFESSSMAGPPSFWQEKTTGDNSGEFLYPALPAKDGLKAAALSIDHYISGEAGWHFRPVAVNPGDYIYMDYYKADAPTVIEAEFIHRDGSITDLDIATDSPATDYTLTMVDVPISSDVKMVSVSHELRGIGSLTIDDMSLCFRAPLSVETGPPTEKPAPPVSPLADFSLPTRIAQERRVTLKP